MIRFSCPACKAVLQLHDSEGGKKVNCSSCGQRLQVPKPLPNKTVLGDLLPPKPSVDSPRRAPAAQPRPSVAPSTPSPGNWYFCQANRQVGPVDVVKLRGLLEAGSLPPSTLVWKQGMSEWLPAEEVKGLSAAQPGRRSRLPWVIGAASMVTLLFVGVMLWGLRSSPQTVSKSPPQTDQVAKGSASEQNPKKQTMDPEPEEPTKNEAENLTPTEIVATSEKAVALIKAKYGLAIGSGTGFLVRPDLVATNYHVVERTLTNQLSVFFPSGGEQGKKPLGVAQVVFFDRQLDLAVLAIKQPPSTLKPLPLASNYIFKRAQEIIVIGNPGFGGDVPNIENAVSRGITSTELVLDGVNAYQLDITVNPGNSGGPVLDGKGRVIGVIKSKASKQERISFCVPVRELTNALAKVEKLGEQERDKLTSVFNARVVLRRMNWTAQISDFGTVRLENAWQRAVNVNSPALQAIQAEQNNFKASLRPLAKVVWDTKDISDQMARIGTDALLPETTRQDLASAWQIHKAIDDSFFVVQGRLKDYIQSNQQNIKKMRDLVGKLRITLGVTEEELKVPPS